MSWRLAEAWERHADKLHDRAESWWVSLLNSNPARHHERWMLPTIVMLLEREEFARRRADEARGMVQG